MLGKKLLIILSGVALLLNAILTYFDVLPDWWYTEYSWFGLHLAKVLAMWIFGVCGVGILLFLLYEWIRHRSPARRRKSL